MPSYHRLDLRVTRRIETRRGHVHIFLDAFNLYNRRNPRTVIPYVTNFRGDGYDVSEFVDRLLPRLPSFGVSWQF
jgi:hypothetical protein